MLLIQNAYLKPITAPDIPGGSILIDGDDKIAALGKDLQVPEGTEILDAQGRLVTPGCVEAHCHIGLDNEATGWEGHDYNETVDPLTPQVRAIDSINPLDEAFSLALQGVSPPPAQDPAVPTWWAAPLPSSSWPGSGWTRWF